MKKIKLIALACLLVFLLSACTKGNTQQQPQKEKTPVSEPIVVGTSSSCDVAPSQLTLAGKTYHQSDKPTAEKGPMKLAYVKCENGNFTMGDADNGYVIYSAGKTNDIYLAGGRTEKVLRQFYSLDQAQPPANQTVGNDARKPMDVQLTKEQVKGMFGDQYTEVTDAVTGEWKVWRFDIGAKSNYKYEAKNDTVDTDGIKNQNIKGQVFVTWDANGKLVDIVYFGLKDGSVKAYYINGFTEENVG